MHTFLIHISSHHLHLTTKLFQGRQHDTCVGNEALRNQMTSQDLGLPAPSFKSSLYYHATSKTLQIVWDSFKISRVEYRDREFPELKKNYMFLAKYI